jgi:hypothetical protein
MYWQINKTNYKSRTFYNIERGSEDFLLAEEDLLTALKVLKYNLDVFTNFTNRDLEGIWIIEINNYRKKIMSITKKTPRIFDYISRRN